MNKFFSNLSLKWYKYLVAFIVSIILWVIVVDIVIAPKKNERIEIFIGSYGVSSEINEAVEKPSYIEELVFTDVMIGESYYFILFSSYASSEDVDLFIVKESQFRESDIQYYQKLSSEDIEKNFGVFEYFTVNDDIYGIKIYDSKTKTGLLSDYIKYIEDGEKEEDYYLFFSKHSIHLGELNDSQYDGVIQILKQLLDE